MSKPSVNPSEASLTSRRACRAGPVQPDPARLATPRRNSPYPVDAPPSRPAQPFLDVGLSKLGAAPTEQPALEAVELGLIVEGASLAHHRQRLGHRRQPIVPWPA